MTRTACVAWVCFPCPTCPVCRVAGHQRLRCRCHHSGSLLLSKPPRFHGSTDSGGGQRWSEMVRRWRVWHGVTWCDGEAMIRHAPCQTQKCCDEIRAGSHGALCLGVLGLHCDTGNQRKLVTPWQSCRNRETRAARCSPRSLLNNTYARTLISKG